MAEEAMKLGVAILCTMTALGAGGLRAQDRLLRWKVDPHTGNDPELIAEAGYVSYGPFEFGDAGSRPVLTTDIEKLLHPARLLWVETAHFRIGSSLPEIRTPSGREDRRKIRDELTRLAGKLPRVRPTTLRLTPWLRLHLTAQRMEELYAGFRDLAGVTDADFPGNPEEVSRDPDRPYMGEGPYLGQRGKYLVLVLEDKEQYSTYMQTYVGRNPEGSQRWNFRGTDSLLFGTNTEISDRRMKDDTALHCHLVFHVSRNLIDGFRHYSFDLPAWFTDGLAHWFERRISPRWNSVPESQWAIMDTRSVWQWEDLADELVHTGDYAPFTDVHTWRRVDEFAFEDHVLVWSRVDFLIAQGKEKLSGFLHRITGREPRDPAASVRQALQSTYGLSVVDFDRAWLEWLER